MATRRTKRIVIRAEGERKESNAFKALILFSGNRIMAFPKRIVGGIGMV